MVRHKWMQKDEKMTFWEVKTPPIFFPGGNVYISKEEETITFKCPCGCGDIIKLSTIPDAKPKWTYTFPDTIKPSIHRIVNCKSHFSIENGEVKFH